MSLQQIYALNCLHEFFFAYWNHPHIKSLILSVREHMCLSTVAYTFSSATVCDFFATYNTCTLWVRKKAGHFKFCYSFHKCELIYKILSPDISEEWGSVQCTVIKPATSQSPAMQYCTCTILWKLTKQKFTYSEFVTSKHAWSPFCGSRHKD